MRNVCSRAKDDLGERPAVDVEALVYDRDLAERGATRRAHEHPKVQARVARLRDRDGDEVEVRGEASLVRERAEVELEAVRAVDGLAEEEIGGEVGGGDINAQAAVGVQGGVSLDLRLGCVEVGDREGASDPDAAGLRGAETGMFGDGGLSVGGADEGEEGEGADPGVFS